MKLLSARTAVAVPAALCLALGGALLMAGPASAAGATLAVTSPTATTPVTTANPVAFSGTGLPVGDTLAATYLGGANGTTTETATVADVADTTGEWTANISFPDTAPGQKSVSYSLQALDAGVADGAPVTATFAFDTAPTPLPAATATATPSAATIEQASDTGFAVAAENFLSGEPVTVTVATASGTAVTPVNTPTALANDDGTYDTDVVLPADAPGGDYAVVVTGAVSGQTVTLALAVLGDPTITSPTDGQKITGTSVTFAGTATPGSEILVILDTTADFNSALSTESSPAAMMKAAKSDSRVVKPNATDPTDTFLPVGADGKWTVQATDVPAGDYTFVVVSQVDDGTGQAVVNETGDPLITAAGPVEFTIAPAAVVTTTAVGGGSNELAFTGSQDAVPAVIGGSLLLLAGLGMIVVARRRRTSIEG